MRTMTFKRACAAAACLLAAPLLASATTLTATLSGEAITGGGATAASGFAVLDIDGTNLSYQILTSSLAGPTSAHVHQGAAGTDGDSVIDLGTTFTAGSAFGSVAVDQATVDAILANPAGYHVMVDTSTFPNGAIRGQLIAGVAQDIVLYLPVAAAVSGFEGTFFRTDVRLVNLSGGDADVTLEYYPEGPAGATAPAATSTLTVATGTEAVLDDMVADLLGITDGKGAVIIRADREVRGYARIYNDQIAAGAGTFGQLVRAIPISEAHTAGVVAFLSNQDPASGGFRSNIGWFNPSTSTVQVSFKAWDAATGALLGQRTLSVAGHAQQQVGLASSTLWPSLSDSDDLLLTYEVTGGGHLFVYASIVDNVNGDAIYVAADPLS